MKALKLTPLTVLPRHTVMVSLDPANKQRDDEVIVMPPQRRGISSANKQQDDSSPTSYYRKPSYRRGIS